jgi:DNA-binding transcriptional LysR family regulator
MDRLLSMRVFERVVDDGSFAAAARALDMSPAVVTRLVADLEDHLGVRLLQRTTRRLSLTEAGKTYHSRVRSILQDIDEAHAVTSSQTNELAGVLRLHAPPVLASYVLGPLLWGFRQKYPQVRIDIEVDSLNDPMIEDYDITLLAADASFDANVIARKVIESDVILVASPEYVKRRGMPQTPTDLAGHDCLRLKMTGGRSQAWRMWREPHADQAVDLAGQPVISANHTDTLLRAALDGAGIMSISVDLVAPYLTRGELVRVLHPWIAGRLAVYAAMPSRKFIPQRTRVFLDYLTEESRRQMTAAMEACVACNR